MSQQTRILRTLAPAIALSACAQQVLPEGTVGAPGFFHGLWHGFAAPFALFGHLFNPTIRMYAYPNSGGWYDFGFWLGIIILGRAGQTRLIPKVTTS